MRKTKWQFWIDRGGTFTDIVACNDRGDFHNAKLLSENPAQYTDAAIQGIRDCLGVSADTPLPVEQIDSVRMGTTVATNALLEHKGEPVLLLTTRGMGDALKIAYQQRPDLFALDIRLPTPLYAEVLEVAERIRADGRVERALPLDELRPGLQQAFDRGLRAVAVVFMHAWQYPEHERLAAQCAVEVGFTQVSVSHRISSLVRFVSRGDTTVVDASLSPVLRRYVSQVQSQLPGVPLLFMQSNGSLTGADRFHGRHAVLSGPAGGVVGMVKTARAAGFGKLIGFDMGGTSTDVCHYAGVYERSVESVIAGVRLCTPMMQIHTVAAGGSSILHFDGQRFRVGPDSAGADPGPVAYRRGGPLTITDCNVLLGKLQADFFPAIFGERADRPLDSAQVRSAFEALREQPALQSKTVEQIAEGYLQIAVENMANAIKKISIQRGYNVRDYTLCSFGGASGQHACLVARALGIGQVFIHPCAGVLSALGIGMADEGQTRTVSIEQVLDDALMAPLCSRQAELVAQMRETWAQTDGERPSVCVDTRLHCRYEGSDSTLTIDWCEKAAALRTAFDRQHEQRFGFCSEDKRVVVAILEVEVLRRSDLVPPSPVHPNRTRPRPEYRPVYLDGRWRDVAFYRRESLPPAFRLDGPAVILETTGTTVVESGWRLRVDEQGNLILCDTAGEAQRQSDEAEQAQPRRPDPVELEVFNNRFMSIAEQMGYVLAQTAVSVNIKERMDFSCAIFDADGGLVSNAPHMPVHLGSMSQSIRAVMRDFAGDMFAGDAFVLNDPYNGGTHLPDITVIKPVFDSDGRQVVFYVASRGHHADIGGVTPGSIPPDSRHIRQEGVLISRLKLLEKGRWNEAGIRRCLSSGDHPVRNVEMNLADLKAQLAACRQGEQALSKLIGQYGLDHVQRYMQFVQDNAEASVRRLLTTLRDGACDYMMDDGSRIRVRITVDRQRRSATVDFTGSSEQHAGNFNAPAAITCAAVLYVFRCLVDEAIPLNEGCLKPLNIIVPEGSLLNPRFPAAVVAGNVETSQAVVNALFGALQVLAAAQGTMNNVTWGNECYQYYETLCGGAGAGEGFDGASAVHTHMTNSRLTDPEILESRFPVVIDRFAIRRASGGAGKHRGGDGVIRETRFLQPMTVSVVSGHREAPPPGMAGGGQGQCGRNRLRRADGRIIDLPGICRVQVEAGDCLIIETPGGGGYGPA